jgi:serine/threonine protein kinase
MGEVYRARDTRLGRIVAVKTMKAAHLARLEREARTIAALNHPQICTLHDVGTLPDGSGYLVMEHDLKVTARALLQALRLAD